MSETLQSYCNQVYFNEEFARDDQSSWTRTPRPGWCLRYRSSHARIENATDTLTPQPCGRQRSSRIGSPGSLACWLQRLQEASGARRHSSPAPVVLQGFSLRRADGVASLVSCMSASLSVLEAQLAGWWMASSTIPDRRRTVLVRAGREMRLWRGSPAQSSGWEQVGRHGGVPDGAGSLRFRHCAPYAVLRITLYAVPETTQVYFQSVCVWCAFCARTTCWGAQVAGLISDGLYSVRVLCSARAAAQFKVVVRVRSSSSALQALSCYLVATAPFQQQQRHFQQQQQHASPPPADGDRIAGTPWAGRHCRFCRLPQ